ncbi:MAG: TRAP transporter large permease [Treponema sp.]|jgi:C4-dicarboxylate transporter DctM subunit|nr:TRAP transporter large permease [Treponema sp.]
MATAVLFVTAAVLLAIGVPVGISLGFGMLAVALGFGTTQISFLAQSMYSGFDSLPLTAIPCFMLAGAVMETGGLSKRLVNVADKLVGFTTGGLGTVTVLACMFFGAISGSGPATVAAIGGIMIPYMVKAKYDRTYSTGLSAVAGGLGIIVPPSIPLVIYGVATNTSIGDLFLAGIGPAFVVGILLIITNIFLAKKNGYSGNGEGFHIRELAKAIWDAKWALLMPLIILGGIYGGIFTPTEAAVVAIIYGVIIGIFVYKEMTWKRLLEMLNFNNSFVGGIMLTFAPAAALGAVLALLQIPTALTGFLFSVSDNKIIILLIVNVFLVLVGMVVDTTSANIIFSPILLVALQPYGVDPIHFGIIMTINLAIGFVTPPVAANLFVASGMTGIPMEKIVQKALPFILAMFVALLIVTYIPGVCLGIIRLLGH